MLYNWIVQPKNCQQKLLTKMTIYPLNPSFTGHFHFCCNLSLHQMSKVSFVFMAINIWKGFIYTQIMNVIYTQIMNTQHQILSFKLRNTYCGQINYRFIIIMPIQSKHILRTFIFLSIEAGSLWHLSIGSSFLFYAFALWSLSTPAVRIKKSSLLYCQCAVITVDFFFSWKAAL